MPMPFRIFPDLNLIVVKPTGRITESCVLEYFRTARAHSDFRPGLDRLLENRDLVEADFDFAQMRNIQSNEINVLRHAPIRVRSVFINADDAALGMARMYQSLAAFSGMQDVKIVETRAEAFRYLEFSTPGQIAISEFCDD